MSACRSDRYRTLSAVFPIILRRQGDVAGECTPACSPGAASAFPEAFEVLLHRRRNTGYMDGFLDLAGTGHVDEGETAREACARECAEELGIAVAPEDLGFAHLCHSFSAESVYYDIYFAVARYNGTPRICEPEKCAELGWFPLGNLPDDMIPDRRADLLRWLAGEPYGEHAEVRPAKGLLA